MEVLRLCILLSTWKACAESVSNRQRGAHASKREAKTVVAIDAGGQSTGGFFDPGTSTLATQILDQKLRRKSLLSTQRTWISGDVPPVIHQVTAYRPNRILSPVLTINTSEQPKDVKRAGRGESAKDVGEQPTAKLIEDVGDLDQQLHALDVRIMRQGARSKSNVRHLQVPAALASTTAGAPTAAPEASTDASQPAPAPAQEGEGPGFSWYIIALIVCALGAALALMAWGRRYGNNDFGARESVYDDRGSPSRRISLARTGGSGPLSSPNESFRPARLSKMASVHATNRLVSRIETAVQNGDSEACEKVLKEAELRGVTLPQTAEEYRERMNDSRAAAEFANQVNEKRRVNVSLNAWDSFVDQLAIRTLFECSINDIFPSEHAERVLMSIADDPGYSDEGALFATRNQVGGNHPFVCVPKDSLKRFTDQLMNKCSSLTPDGAIRWDMGLPVTSEKYVFGMTFEKLNLAHHNRKFRVLLIRESLLCQVMDKRPDEVHPDDYYQNRWSVLQQLHDLYFEEGHHEEGRFKAPRRERESILISSPNKPLLLTMAGIPVDPEKA